MEGSSSPLLAPAEAEWTGQPHEERKRYEHGYPHAPDGWMGRGADESVRIFTIPAADAAVEWVSPAAGSSSAVVAGQTKLKVNQAGDGLNVRFGGLGCGK